MYSQTQEKKYTTPKLEFYSQGAQRLQPLPIQMTKLKEWFLYSVEILWTCNIKAVVDSSLNNFSLKKQLNSAQTDELTAFFERGQNQGEFGECFSFRKIISFPEFFK